MKRGDSGEKREERRKTACLTEREHNSAGMESEVEEELGRKRVEEKHIDTGAGGRGGMDSETWGKINSSCVHVVCLAQKGQAYRFLRFSSSRLGSSFSQTTLFHCFTRLFMERKEAGKRAPLRKRESEKRERY